MCIAPLRLSNPTMSVCFPNPALAKKILQALAEDPKNWNDPSKLSVEDIALLKNLLGMSGSNPLLQPDFSFAPFQKHCGRFTSNKVAYAGCEAPAQVMLCYDEKTDTATYTECWPWA